MRQLIGLATIFALVAGHPACSDDTSVKTDGGTDSDQGSDTDTDTDSDTDADTDVIESWEDVDTFIESTMEQALIPGLAAAIVEPGNVVWAKGYGMANVASQTAVTSDTPFMLASVSKTVTATALMQLWEANIFTLDTPVNDLLTGFQVDNPQVEGDSITVRHLMTHTSGIRDNWDVMVPLYSDGDSPIYLGDFLADYLVDGGQWYDADLNFFAFAPGTQWEYGNVATALAGQLVEETTGTALDDHCDEEIFAPLAMDDSGWHLADFDPADVAMPYYLDGDQYVVYGHYGYPDYPDGQLRVSVNDLARFLAAIANAGELDGERILEEATVDEMLTPQIPAVDSSQAVYWYYTMLAGREVFGHGGSDSGVATDMYFCPYSEIGVVVLMNIGWSAQVTQAADNIEEMLFDWAESL